MNSDYRSMTVNERLYVSGFLEEFEQAIKDRDVEKVIFILKKVQIIDQSGIDAILRKHGLLT